MTREEARHIIDNLKPTNTKSSFDAYVVGKALTMAIQALSQEPTDTWSIKDVADTFTKHGLIREQEPCDDVISRQAVFNAIEREDKWLLDAKGHNGLTEMAFSGLKARIDALLPVTQKSGKWIYDETLENWRCSKCNETPKTMGYVGTADFMAEHFKFCNHCGAKMESEEQTE